MPECSGVHFTNHFATNILIKYALTLFISRRRHHHPFILVPTTPVELVCIHAANGAEAENHNKERNGHKYDEANVRCALGALQSVALVLVVASFIRLC